MKVGRNDPCPCGSGKKYKKCHLVEDDRRALAVRDAQEQGRRTGWATSMPEDMAVPSPEQVERWPVRKVWVPVPEVFAVTGHGVAGALRERGPGELVSAYFMLRLTEGGLYGLAHKDAARPEEADEFVAKTMEQMGPSEPGDLARASQLVWACHDYALEVGEPFPRQSQACLALLPRPSGARASIESIAGVGQSVPSALVAMVRAHPLANLGEQKEIAVLTEARMLVADAPGVSEALRAMTPDFDARDGGVFDFTRPSQPQHTAPLSRIRGRRIQGELRVEGNELVARSGLSMMAHLLNALYTKLPERPALRSAQWVSPSLGLRWQWDAEDEPLAMK
jgi:hypothetical protein